MKPATHSIVDFWQSLSPTAQVVGGFATLLAAIFAGVAILYAREQVKAAKKLSAQQHAFNSYTELLKMYVAYPELSNSTLALRYIGCDSFKGIDRTHSPEASRYLWFVSYVLTACEWMFDVLGHRDDWKNAIRAQVRHHKGVLKVHWGRIKENYKQRFRDEVDLVIGEAE